MFRHLKKQVLMGKLLLIKDALSNREQSFQQNLLLPIIK
jgi:hypothetical protein